MSEQQGVMGEAGGAVLEAEGVTRHFKDADLNVNVRANRLKLANPLADDALA